MLAAIQIINSLVFGECHDSVIKWTCADQRELHSTCGTT